MSDDVDDIVTTRDQEVVVSSEVIDRVVVTPETNVLFSVETDVEVVSTAEREVIYGDEERVTVLEEGQQGPQGIPGPPGAAVLTAMAIANVGGHRAVILGAGINSAQHADNQTLDHADRIVGVSRNAASIGGAVQVQTMGEIVEPSWNWVVGPVFVGSDGVLVQSAPVPPAVFSAIVGFATSPTSLYVDVREPILL